MTPPSTRDGLPAVNRHPVDDDDAAGAARTTGIRLIDVADASTLATQLADDADANARWQPAQPASYYTLAGQAARIQGLLEGYHAGTLWPGVVLAGDVVVGQVTVSAIVRGPFRKGTIGYWIAGTAQNQGHAGRAVALALQVMATQLRLHRAETSTRLENLPSQAVLRRNGFTPFGVAHSHIFLAGAWHDGLLWERTLD